MKKILLVIIAIMMLLFSNSSVNAQTLEQAKKKQVEQALNGPHGQQIKNSVKRYSKKYGVEETLILAVIMTESGFNPRAISSCRATGLMQLIPSTFRARKVGNNIYDIDQNVEAGTKHLSGLIARHHGNVYLALASYNMGGAKVPVQGAIPKAARPYVNRVYYHKGIIEEML